MSIDYSRFEYGQNSHHWFGKMTVESSVFQKPLDVEICSSEDG